MIFMSDTVISENYWWITSWVTTDIVINCNPFIVLFLTRFSGAEAQMNWWKLSLIDRCSIVVVLWRHANTYCDVILVDCHENISKWVHVRLPTIVKLIITHYLSRIIDGIFTGWHVRISNYNYLLPFTIFMQQNMIWCYISLPFLKRSRPYWWFSARPQ